MTLRSSVMDLAIKSYTYLFTYSTAGRGLTTDTSQPVRCRRRRLAEGRRVVGRMRLRCRWWQLYSRVSVSRTRPTVDTTSCWTCRPDESRSRRSSSAATTRTPSHDKDPSHSAKGGIVNSMFVFARWQHWTDGLAACFGQGLDLPNFPFS